VIHKRKGRVFHDLPNIALSLYSVESDEMIIMNNELQRCGGGNRDLI
jgi:hypothetical protein